MHDYEDLLKRLIDNGVEFVIIGGFAAVAHGCTVFTRDVDLCVDFSRENMMNLLKALDGLNPRFQQNKRRVDKTPDELALLKNIYLLTDKGSIDLLGFVAGIGRYEQVRARSVQMELFGRPCRVLDIDALIDAKKEMARPKDKETVIQLEALRERQKDRDR